MSKSARLKEIQQNAFNSSQDLRTKLQKTMFDLRQMQWEKNPDQAKLNAKINEINSLRNQLYQQNQKTREQMSTVLTQEQLAKIGRQAFGCDGRGFGHRGGM